MRTSPFRFSRNSRPREGPAPPFHRLGRRPHPGGRVSNRFPRSSRRPVRLPAGSGEWTLRQRPGLSPSVFPGVARPRRRRPGVLAGVPGLRRVRPGWRTGVPGARSTSVRRRNPVPRPRNRSGPCRVFSEWWTRTSGAPWSRLVPPTGSVVARKGTVRVGTCFPWTPARRF